MKKRLFFIIILTLIIFTVQTAFAQTNNDNLDQIIQEILEKIDFSKAESIFGEIPIKDWIISVLNNDFESSTSILQHLFNMLTSEISRKLPSLITVFAIVVLHGLLSKNKSGFLSESSADVVYLVCYSLILLLILGEVTTLYSKVYNLLDNVSVLLDVFMPIIITLLIATGGVTAGQLYQPLTGTLSTSIIGGVSKIILPLFALSLVFCIISNLSENVKLTKLSKLFTNLASTLLGLFFMVFSAFLTTQGVYSNTKDTISAKTVKFATKNYIPILGGYLSDGLELVLASATLVKNSIGSVALFVLIFIVLTPIFELLTYSICLKVLSAFTEPLGDDKFSTFFIDVSKNLTMLIVCVVAVLFLVSILILLCMTSATYL